MSGVMKPLLESYNGLVVAKDLGYSEGKRRKAIFICKYCGNEFKTRVERVAVKRVSSCGCKTKELQKIKRTKHGDCSVESRTHGIRSSWANMKARCLNKNTPFYHRYGGRGIEVCEEWKNSYLKFKKWSLRNGWKEGLQIDRIDVNGNYEPSNCQWITNLENNQGDKRRETKPGKTGVKYISQHSQNRTYFGQKSIMGKRYYTSQYKTIEEAKKALEKLLEGKIA